MYNLVGHKTMKMNGKKLVSNRHGAYVLNWLFSSFQGSVLMRQLRELEKILDVSASSTEPR